MRIEIISGSTRLNSLTRRVALHLKTLLPDTIDTTIGIIDMQEHALPPVQNVWQHAGDAPAHTRDIAHRMFEADAFIVVSPEYNGSYSPALKNFLDHFPKQERKVFGIVTASPGALGGIRAALQLQSLVDGLFGIGSPKMLIVPAVDKKFANDGTLIDLSFKPAIDSFISEFVWLAGAIHGAALKQTRLVA